MYISVHAVMEMIAFERKKELGPECKELSIIIAEPFFEVLVEELNFRNKNDIRSINIAIHNINITINKAENGMIGDREFYYVLLGRPYYVNPDTIKG